MKPKIFNMPFSELYPAYIAKAERKGRTKNEVDIIILWFTGYTWEQFSAHLEQKTDIETFMTSSPFPNPAKSLITGVVCKVRVEEVEDPIMRDIRYLDKLIDELAKGKKMEKILRRFETD